MSCENKVTLTRPKGWDYVQYQAKCGTTDYYGGTVTCPQCLERRGGVPNGYCRHGVRITEFDCDCFRCEMGED